MNSKNFARRSMPVVEWDWGRYVHPPLPGVPALRTNRLDSLRTRSPYALRHCKAIQDYSGGIVRDLPHFLLTSTAHCAIMHVIIRLGRNPSDTGHCWQAVSFFICSAVCSAKSSNKYELICRPSSSLCLACRIPATDANPLPLRARSNSHIYGYCGQIRGCPLICRQAGESMALWPIQCPATQYNLSSKIAGAKIQYNPNFTIQSGKKHLKNVDI